jgi:class 3 adenylate cyclase
VSDLPTGTVAFLMTDMEGSTRLVRDLGTAFPALLDEHFRLLGAAIGGEGGTLISSEGDSVFAVFPSARQAVRAAVAGQPALADHDWPDGASVRVRMGVNAGDAVLGGRDYTGLEVHRTARVMAAGLEAHLAATAQGADAARQP